MLMTISFPSPGTLIFIPNMLHSIVWLEGRIGSVFMFGWSDEMNLIADLLTLLTMDPHVIQTWFLPLSLCSATQVRAVFAAGHNPAYGTTTRPGLLAAARPCCSSSSSAEPPGLLGSSAAQPSPTARSPPPSHLLGSSSTRRPLAMAPSRALAGSWPCPHHALTGPGHGSCRASTSSDPARPRPCASRRRREHLTLDARSRVFLERAHPRILGNIPLREPLHPPTPAPRPNSTLDGAAPSHSHLSHQPNTPLYIMHGAGWFTFR
jgi:hypothetical protein